MKTILTLSSVVKEFQKAKAVDELSFSVEDGEIFALLGPNGAGKTTTVRMIMQIIQPDRGEIRFDPAINGQGRVMRSRLGYLPEERGLYQDMPVLENLVYLAGLCSNDPNSIRKEALQWLERFGLADRKRDKVSALSKGNQQKIQFIASILHRPALAVLDEPFSGFDPINQELMSDVIRDLRNAGTTILLSAHQMQLVERIADRILLLDSGRERICGTLAEIRKKTISARKIEVGFDAGVDPSALSRIPGIKAVESLEQEVWTVYPEENADLNRILNGFTEAGRVRHLQTADAGLHEIFLHSFTNTNMESK
ncbi:ATP-binding cassette domain-containing protein [Balneolales bacterium ANBcel1]|nr:ATP-binding cassette domain-containing protein [Balneolales bacterium ANBcel1]